MLNLTYVNLFVFPHPPTADWINIYHQHSNPRKLLYCVHDYPFKLIKTKQFLGLKYAFRIYIYIYFFFCWLTRERIVSSPQPVFNIRVRRYSSRKERKKRKCICCVNCINFESGPRMWIIAAHRITMPNGLDEAAIIQRILKCYKWCRTTGKHVCTRQTDKETKRD